MNNNLIWIIGVMVVLWAVWFGTGGPQGSTTDRPFLKAPPPIDTGETYGPPNLIPSGEIIRKRTDTKTTEEEKVEEEKDPQISIFGGKVSLTFRGKTGARSNDPQKEYIEIIASKNNAQPILVSGWTLKSAVTGKSGIIGPGSYLPYSGRVNTEQPVYLKPNEKAIITTGRSPIGVSFRLNTCTGYLEQFQNFTPLIPKQCPDPEKENIPTGLNGVTDACLDFIERLPRCEVYIEAIPLQLSNDPVCQEYLVSKITYNSCLDTHKGETNFYRNEWRIFLKRSQELWKTERETILLLDESGKLVDSLTY